MQVMNEDRYESRLPRFNGSPEDAFHSWSLRIRAALRSRELASTLTDDEVSSHILEKVLAIIINALEEIIQESFKNMKRPNWHGRNYRPVRRDNW